MKLPVLVDCPPYNCRLQESSCVDRYNKAQGVSLDGKGMGHGQRAMLNGTRRNVLRNCIGCATGKERAADAA